MPSESSARARGNGKWGRTDVPHTGWTCVDYEDRGEPDFICEMCEVQAIRYIHYMVHPLHPQRLACGCICSSFMEGSVFRAQEREHGMRSHAERRERWLTRRWRTSRKGNPFLNTEDLNIVIFPVFGGRWGFRVERRDDGRSAMHEATYTTPDEAKLAIFDAIWSRKRKM